MLPTYLIPFWVLMAFQSSSTAEWVFLAQLLAAARGQAWHSVGMAVLGACPGRSGKPEPQRLITPESFREPRTQEILVLPHAVLSIHTHVPY